MRRADREVRRNPGAAAVAAALFVAAFALYLPVRGHGFLNYDDSLYITDNPRVAAGLTWQGVAWAFTTWHAGNWHPLAWISHMADVTLFGMDPAGHHLMSAALHAATAATLFLAWRALTGALWAPALVAALFAVHPLHVESVAWAAERKDVLMGACWALALLAHARFAAHPTAKRRLALLGACALALLAKPASVALPVALLVLDYWPLGRMRRGSIRPLLQEKALLFAGAAAVAAVTVLAQNAIGALELTLTSPWRLRAANATLSYATYLWKTLFPAGLAHYYPHSLDGLGAAAVTAAGVSLAGATWLFARLARSRPWLAAGWLWYLLTLLPMIGLVQVGAQAMADRYTYLPLLGIFVAAAWEARARAAARPRSSALVLVGVCAALVALLPLARRQIGFWSDDVALSRHTLGVTTGNWFVENNLGVALLAEGRHEEAIAHFQAALRWRPAHANALNNVGVALLALGRGAEAVSWFASAVDAEPGNARMLVNLANARLAARGLDGSAGRAPTPEEHVAEGTRALLHGRTREAEAHLRAALALRAGQPQALYALGITLLRTGRRDEAEKSFREAVRADSGHLDARLALGAELAQRGERAEAEALFREATRIAPQSYGAWFNLGVLLHREGRREESLAALREAARLKPEAEETRALLRLLEPGAGAAP